MNPNQEINQLIDSWQTDTLGLKPAFMEYYEFLKSQPGLSLDFKSRPGVSYSMRASHKNQSKRELFTLIDVIDDEPDSRWLSVCFYADLISDPNELGDFVPQGLLGEDALCFNLDSNDSQMQEYILGRIKEAMRKASE